MSGGNAANGGAIEPGKARPVGGMPGYAGTYGVNAVNAKRDDLKRINNIGTFGSPWCGRAVEGRVFNSSYVSLKSELKIICREVSLTQSELSFSRARMDYFASDPSTGHRGKLLAIDKIKWLYESLDNCPDKVKENPRYQSLFASVTAQLKNLGTHKDFFGNAYNWVPLGSENLFVKNYESAAVFYKEVVELKTKLSNHVKFNDEKKSNLHSIAHKAEKIKKINENRLEEMSGLIEKQNIILDKQTKKIESSKKELKDALDKFGKDVTDPAQGPSGISFEDVIDVMQMLSFMPHGGQTKSPVGDITAAAGAAAGAASPLTMATQALNAGGQVLKLANKAVNYTKTDSGQPIRRDYIVSQTVTLGRDLDLLKEVPQLINHKLEMKDKNGIKLMSERDQIESLCNNFRKGFSGYVIAIEKRLDDFTNDVQFCNAKILEYNTIVSALIEAHGQIIACDNQIQQVDSNLREVNEPDVEILLSFVNSLAEKAKETCLYQLYLAQRAIKFSWLEETADLLTFDNPLAITSIELDSKKQKLVTALQTETLASKHPAQPFPSYEKRSVHRGKFIEINEEDYSEELQELRETGETEVSFAAVRKETASSESQFSHMSDIRIAKVRAWFIFDDDENHGLRTITLTHQGIENIINRKNEFQQFIHDEQKVNFEYRYDGKANQLDEIIHGELSNEDIDIIYKNISLGLGKSDGDLHHMDDQLSKSYALVGPFTTWKINSHDWRPEKLKKIYFEFHGVNYSFD